jgi:putative heme-binding domain-containing protein
MHGLGAMDGTHREATAAAVGALGHPSAGVRRNALLVLPRDAASLDAILASGALADADGQVRLAALLALAEMPVSPQAAEALVPLLADEPTLGDPWLRDAVTCAAAAHDRAFLRVFAAVRTEAEPAGTSDRAGEAVAIVAEHYARGGPAEDVGTLLAALAGGPADAAEAVLVGLERGWPDDVPAMLDKSAEQALVELLPRLPVPARGPLVALAGRLGSRTLDEYAGQIAAAFLATVEDEAQDEGARVAAARQFIEFQPQSAEAAAELLAVLTPRTSPDLSRGLVEAAGRSQAAGTGEAILESLAVLTPAARPAGLAVLLGRAEWTEALLAAAEEGTAALTELSLDQRQSLAAHPDAALAERARALLAKGGGLPDPDRQRVLEELLPVAGRQGSAALGKEVFKKQCAKCHTHSGEGARVGPDLTGMAVHPKAEMLAQIIDPSRSVEGNFRVYTVVTEDGRVLTGLLAAESRTTLELFDAEGKRQTVLREEVAELAASRKSLMPEGFEKQVSADELANLLEFLAQRGKYLPIPLGKAATIVSTRGMFYSEDAGLERIVFDDWTPKTFRGVPFHLVDPRGDQTPNVVLLHGPQGRFPPQMPRSVALPCNAPAKAVHFLSGISGWGHPLGEEGSVSMIVRLHYADGQTEDHALKNGVEFADYIRRVDVPGSEFAFAVRGQQVRYLVIQPDRPEVIRQIELVKGPDATAPLVVAVTVETR